MSKPSAWPSPARRASAGAWSVLSGPAGGRGERFQVAAEERREVGVDDRGRAALVLAKLRQHLRGGGDMHARELVAEARGDRPLVGGLEVGEEEADRHRLGAELAHRSHDSLDLVGAERLDHARRPDPLRDADPRLGRDERRRRGPAEVVEARAVLARDLEQVGEPAGRDERRPRPALLE
jgi:hypothetical protein